ncbi:unnamed protein product [Tetraodon nigroviridis]|uniref:(spotted green pufferfish) hypothetical protein n=1 Tax=Tetraodon nigroviridis TaxID=99883 RepID=Q4S3M1_TETNG|nr:unnamed protein product [Tetraodon nigroviridis]
MYEPQLANATASPNMEVFDRRQNMDLNVTESQAVPDDYTNSGFTKGHLNPSMHQGTGEDRNATFTLTNIVPQKQVSNQKTWLRVEQKWKRFASYCNGSMYVITERRINDRVSVPEYLWSAYCCQSVSDQLPADVKAFFSCICCSWKK